MIVITRPSPYGEQLMQMCLAVNLAAKHLPLFNILPGRDLNTLSNQLQQLVTGDVVIITSPQVIYALAALKHLPTFPDDVNYFSVGQQTAQLFNQLTGRSVDYPAVDENSEGLLALLNIQTHQVPHQKVLILRGNQGRTLIRDTLSRQGYQVILVECYQRQSIGYSQTVIDDLGQIEMIIVTSVEHLLMLDQYCTMEHRQSIRLIVTNIRTEQHAKQLKWHHITLTSGANNQNLFKTITTLCHNVNYFTLHEK